MNVLITSASRKVTLVKYFQKALSEEGEGKVIAVDINPISPALYFADDYFLIPKSDDPNFIDAMMRLCKKQDIRLLLPTRDEELPLFAAHKKEFLEIHTLVMVPDPETVAICQDKKRFGEFCHDKGLGTPRLIERENVTADKFPLFVKARFGKGSKGIAQADSFEDLGYWLKHVEDPIIQEYVDAPEFTVDLFADFEGRIISVIPRQRMYVFGGESFITKTVRHTSIIEESFRLAEELKLVGHNTIQCFLDGGTVKFIEVNPRYGGASHLGFAAGASTPLFLVKLLHGRPVEPITDFKDDYLMLRYTDDLFIYQADLTQKRFS